MTLFVFYRGRVNRILFLCLIIRVILFLLIFETKKRFILLYLIIVLFYTTRAQNDTIFFLSFDAPSLPTYFTNTEDTVSLGVWQNYSFDSIPASNNRPDNWYLEPGFADVDSNNQVLVSSSWLELFQPGNRNYLISPGFYLPDASTELSWFSASWHTPVYLDGYPVLLSTTGNARESFTDTLFRAAQYLGALSEPDSTSPIPIFNNYRFSEGFIQGYDGTYIEFDGDSTDFKGVLQPHSVSLSSYSGDTVHLAFVHDSDDDNLISLDNILLKGTRVISQEEIEINPFTVFPNPAHASFNVSFTSKSPGSLKWRIMDLSGRIVLEGVEGAFLPGDYKVLISAGNPPSGNYLINLAIDGIHWTEALILD